MWDDIEKFGNMPYFFGAIMCHNTNGEENSVQIIDGQQRITTFSLLLLALLNSEKLPQEYKDKVKKCVYEAGRPENETKLKQVHEHKNQYQSIIANNRKPEYESSNIYQNYDFFVSEIKKSENIESFIQVLFEKLYIVEMRLGTDDNAQIVFEKLNSTGKDLQLADKIRNHIFMRIPNNGMSETDYADKQEHYFNDFWRKIEKNISLPYADDFFQKYISHKQGTDISQQDAFKEFTTYIKDTDYKAVFKDILKYSEYYFLCRFPDMEWKLEEKWTNEQITVISELKPYMQFLIDNNQTTQITYFMGVLDLYANGDLSKDETEQAFKFTQNYYASRQIMEKSHQGYNKEYCKLNKEIKELREKKSLSYVEALVYYFYNGVSDAKKASTTDQFKREIKFTNFYRLKILFLCEIAKKHQKDLDISPISTNNKHKFTVEHILAKNPERWQEKYKDWKNKQDIYLHTLGNLALLNLSDNSSANDKSFVDKKYIFADSDIKITKELADAEDWDIEKIEERTKKYTKDIVKLWGLKEFEEMADKVKEKIEQKT